jgi:hypothetical protein
VPLAAVHVCVAADSDFQVMLLDMSKKHSQFIAVVGYADAQVRHVTLTAYALKVADYHHIWCGIVLEIFVDILEVACALRADEAAHQFAQQLHQHTAVSYFAHSAQHAYQVTTVVLFVISALVLGLVAATAAISTAAVVLVT